MSERGILLGFFKGDKSLFSHTAAHCFQPKYQDDRLDPESIEAHFNLIDMTAPINGSQTVQIDVLDIIVHPKWSTFNDKFDADIAIVILYDKVQFSDFIQPVCLPNRDKIRVSEFGYLAGWGKTDNSLRGRDYSEVLMELETLTLNASFCYENFKEVSNIASDHSDHMFCGGFENQTTGACTGDSGGGFYTIEDGTSPFVIEGIVSSGLLDNFKQCRIDQPSLYTNVAWYIDWINEEVEKLETKEVELDCLSERSIQTYYYQYVKEYLGCSNGFQGPYNQDIKIKPNATFLNFEEVVMNFGNSPKVLSGVGLAFPKVKKLKIEGYSLKWLKRRNFRNLENLRELTLLVPNLDIVTKDALVNLSMMKKIRLHSNKLRKPSEILFSNLNLKSLEFFSQERNCFTRKDDGGVILSNKTHDFFDNLHHIEELTLLYIHPIYQGSLLLNMSKLKAFSISTTATIFEPTKELFSGIPDLKVLEMIGCELNGLPSDVFDGIPNLEKLELRENFRLNLDEYFVFKLPNIQRLSLDDISIKPTKQMFSRVPKLKILTMRHCKLTSIPFDVFDNVPNLEVLDLSFNNELALGDLNYKLPRLKKLDLKSTSTRPPKDMLTRFPNITYLNNYILDPFRAFKYQPLLNYFLRKGFLIRAKANTIDSHLNATQFGLLNGLVTENENSLIIGLDRCALASFEILETFQIENFDGFELVSMKVDKTDETKFEIRNERPKKVDFSKCGIKSLPTYLLNFLSNIEILH